MNAHDRNSPEAGQASDPVCATEAEVAYLALCVPGRDLRGLGTLSRTNPQHKSWAPMQLYMQSQVSR